MKSKIFKKIAVCFASALVVCSIGAFTGCTETNHPEVRITYQFNGESYTVDYKLYRNMYTHTVRHFIELADEGFYDGTVIHDYQTNDFLSGAYSYDAAEYSAKVNNAEQMGEYLEQFSKEDAYAELAGKLSASVYSELKYDDNGNEYVSSDNALPTVMGEFYNNIHQEIEKGALTADYGCLKMYYYQTESKQKVYVAPTSDQIITADYKNNCATSVFAVQTGVSSSLTEKNYTVFAQLKDTENFDKLVAALRDYIKDNHSSSVSDFCTSVQEVDVGSDFKSVTFSVPKLPIIIESVKVTKY